MTFSALAVLADNTSEGDATTHQGYVFEFGDLTIYNVGDTRKEPEVHAERFAAVANLRPDVMMVPINEGANNPGPAGAVWLTEWVRPRIVIPCHFDCFKGNTIDPQRFVEAAPDALHGSIHVAQRGEMFLIE